MMEKENCSEEKHEDLVKLPISNVIPSEVERNHSTPNEMSLNTNEKESRNRCQENGGDIIEREALEVGNVPWSVFRMYLESMGVATFFFILFFILASESVGVGTGFWLVRWSSEKNVTDKQSYSFIGGYGALGGTQACLLFIYAVILSLGTVFASKSIHRRLVEVILFCPMAFFESNPLGRIMNRFSKDINVLDDEIYRNADGALMRAIKIVAIIFVISYSTPLFIAAFVPIAVLYFFGQKLFVASARQLKRIEAIRRSPVFNHFLESIHGTTTIRAFSSQKEFINENGKRIDHNQAAHFAQFAIAKWLNLRLDLCGALIVFFASLFCVVQRKSISAGVAGISLAFTAQITKLSQMMVRLASDLEINIISVERTKNFLELRRNEKWEGNKADTKAFSSCHNVYAFDNHFENDWPLHGVVSFQNYSARYGDGLDLALDNINFTTKSQEKVGIVGRTGAGKSSITMALFRIIDGSSGTIFIDGVDIRNVGLNELRSKLSIIPQDPVLFSGTIRFNLDPSCIRSDSDIWNALELSHLKGFLATHNEGLSFQIEDSGNNLSIGQRQLVCLARALLRKSKILVLDEATAGVDVVTDALIQETIREQFHDSTVLTIAHRLNTVMEYDRILVLDKGRIMQFDTPQNLISLKSGMFYKMVVDAGCLPQQTEGNQ